MFKSCPCQQRFGRSLTKAVTASLLTDFINWLISKSRHKIEEKKNCTKDAETRGLSGKGHAIESQDVAQTNQKVLGILAHHDHT